MQNCRQMPPVEDIVAAHDLTSGHLNGDETYSWNGWDFELVGHLFARAGKPANSTTVSSTVGSLWLAGGTLRWVLG